MLQLNPRFFLHLFQEAASNIRMLNIFSQALILLALTLAHFHLKQ